jgi:hypothetical protein
LVEEKRGKGERGKGKDRRLKRENERAHFQQVV